MPNQYDTNYPEVCTVEGCDKKHKSRGYCSTCYGKFIERDNKIEKNQKWGRPPMMIPGYHAMHDRIYKEYGRPEHCSVCLSSKNVEYAFIPELSDKKIVEQQGADAGRSYGLDPSHYLPLCKLHHNLMDGVGGNHDRENLGLTGLLNETAVSEVPGTVIATATGISPSQELSYG